jgi:hypothetical protein
LTGPYRGKFVTFVLIHLIKHHHHITKAAEDRLLNQLSDARDDIKRQVNIYIHIYKYMYIYVYMYVYIDY